MFDLDKPTLWVGSHYEGCFREDNELDEETGNYHSEGPFVKKSEYDRLFKMFETVSKALQLAIEDPNPHFATIEDYYNGADYLLTAERPEKADGLRNLRTGGQS